MKFLHTEKIVGSSPTTTTKFRQCLTETGIQSVWIDEMDGFDSPGSYFRLLDSTWKMKTRRFWHLFGKQGSVQRRSGFDSSFFRQFYGRHCRGAVEVMTQQAGHQFLARSTKARWPNGVGTIKSDQRLG